MSNGVIVTETTLTAFIDGKVHTIPSSSTNFDKMVTAAKSQDWDTLSNFIDLEDRINTSGEGRVTVSNGVVYYDEKEVHNSLTSRIVRMLHDGWDVKPMLRFMDRLMKNPSGRAVQELYRFLESNNLPILEDGRFAAYKNVNENYYDKYSGKFRNMIGDVCEMPRNEVMDDPNQTCSAGLHFCSIEYLNSGWGHGGHTMVVAIDPADVVSIPVDYNNSKGRCCKYEVIAEHIDRERDTLSEKTVYEWGWEDEEDEWEDEDEWYEDDSEVEYLYDVGEQVGDYVIRRRFSGDPIKYELVNPADGPVNSYMTEEALQKYEKTYYGW